MTAYPFLSDDWIAAARDLRARYADRLPSPPVPIRLNVVVTDIPHRPDGKLDGHVDTTDGQTLLDEGHVEEAEVAVTVDYGVARAAFVERDPQAVMQAFIQGRILVDGDASQLMAFQAAQVSADTEAQAEELYREMRAFTADDDQ